MAASADPHIITNAISHLEVCRIIQLRMRCVFERVKQGTTPSRVECDHSAGHSVNHLQPHLRVVRQTAQAQRFAVPPLAQHAGCGAVRGHHRGHPALVGRGPRRCGERVRRRRFSRRQPHGGPGAIDLRRPVWPRRIGFRRVSETKQITPPNPGELGMS